MHRTIGLHDPRLVEPVSLELWIQRVDYKVIHGFSQIIDFGGRRGFLTFSLFKGQLYVSTHPFEWTQECFILLHIASRQHNVGVKSTDRSEIVVQGTNLHCFTILPGAPPSKPMPPELKSGLPVRLYTFSKYIPTNCLGRRKDKFGDLKFGKKSIHCCRNQRLLYVCLGS